MVQQSQSPLTKRLHIGGLTNPAITHADLSKRFSSFGQVTSVEAVGSDGNGFPRNFAYLTIITTHSQISRCFSLLSGSTWKGSTLRVSEAKPSFEVRLEKEKSEMRPSVADAEGSSSPANVLESAKRKKTFSKRKRGVQGIEAKDMNIVTLESCKRLKQWHLTPLQHLIRPIRLRPTKPIPRPALLPIPSAASTSISKASTLKSKDEAKKKKKTGAKRKAAPPVRARRITLDPTRYNTTHLTGEFLCSDFDQSIAPPSLWVCDEDEDDSGRVRWVREGSEEEVENVLIDRVERLERILGTFSDSSGPTSAAPAQVPALPPATATSLPAKDEESEVELDEDDEDEDAQPSSRLESMFKSPSPAPSGEDDDVDVEYSKEKSLGLDVLKGMFGSIFNGSDDGDEKHLRTVALEGSDGEGEVATPVVPEKLGEKKRKPEPTPTSRFQPPVEIVTAIPQIEEDKDADVEDAEEDEEEVDPNDPVQIALRELREWEESQEREPETLRLRGGCYSMALRLRGGMAEDDSESDDSDGESDDESESAEDAEPETKKVKVNEVVNPPKSGQSALKEMFKPAAASAGGFSLFAMNDDLDLDPEADPTLFAALPTTTHSVPVVITQQRAAASSTSSTIPTTSITSAQQAPFVPSTDQPYFIPFLHLSEAEASKGPKVQSKSVLSGFEGGFWRNKTEAEIEESWKTAKSGLTKEWKRVHREAVKRKRRKGGNAGEDDDEGEKFGA